MRPCTHAGAPVSITLVHLLVTRVIKFITRTHTHTHTARPHRAPDHCDADALLLKLWDHAVCVHGIVLCVRACVSVGAGDSEESFQVHRDVQCCAARYL